MKPQTARAREFRRNMSGPEVMLWSRLKRLREQGFHFRRQAPFKGFFLDFVCYAHRVVVEVDGSQHADDVRGAHDAMRDSILRRHGFTVMRFWTREVREDLTGTVDHILQVLKAAPRVWESAHRREPSPDQASPP